MTFCMLSACSAQQVIASRELTLFDNIKPLVLLVQYCLMSNFSSSWSLESQISLFLPRGAQGIPPSPICGMFHPMDGKSTC